MDPQFEQDRRNALQTVVALAAGTLVSNLAIASTTSAAPAENPTPKPEPGKAGDFDFLSGEWRISHRRLKSAGTDDWDEFTGEATCWSILGGIGSVEELRIPARSFSGMGLRLLDLNAGIWNDFWVNGKSGVLSTPGQTGHFSEGTGIFMADDMDGAQPIKVRGIWDRITANSCRWHQAISRDAGKTWEPNWFMDWTRA